MRKGVYLIVGLLILTTACTSKKEQQVDVKEKTKKEKTSKEPMVYSFIRPFENYFATSKVSKNTELSLDSIQFENKFHFAATMDNKPVKINFQHERVGAIVLPETAFDTEIVLDTNFVKNDTLHVLYTIKTGQEKRSFTTVPVQLFSYNSRFKLLFENQK